MTAPSEGARYLASNRDLRCLGVIAFLWPLCLGMQVPLFIVYVKSRDIRVP